MTHSTDELQRISLLSEAKHRRHVPELDYLKSVFIVLMVAFHLVSLGDAYPYAKQVVYTFHMPGFLLISGYLMNVGKPLRAFGRMLWWILVPYAVMETAYVCASAWLPVRDGVEQLSVGVVAWRLFVAPMGPYWYLHTWLLCGAAYYVVFRLWPWRCSVVSRLVIYALVLYGLSLVAGLVTFANAMYFWAGVALKQGGVDFLRAFRPTGWALVACVGLCAFPANLDRGTLGGVAVVWTAVSFLLWVYRWMPRRVWRVCEVVGRNTLPVLLFSPVFTMLSRGYYPWFDFDPTGLCFAVVSVVLAVAGSLLLARVADAWHLSPWFFGKRRILSSGSQHEAQA